MTWRVWLLALMLVSCSKKDVLQFNLITEAMQLDWNRASDYSSVVLLENVMEGLTTYANSVQGSRAELIRPVPALASSWTISEQGRLYRFHLRRDVLWSDGVPLKAKHFVDSWRRLLARESRMPNAHHFFDIENAQAFNEGKASFSAVGIKVVDDYTLDVHLRRPVPYFLHLVASVNSFPVRADLIESFGDDWTLPENLVTLGAYRIAEWNRGESLLLRSYGEYWGDEPAFSSVLCKIITEPITAFALYENGELDIIPRDIPSFFARRLQKHPDYRTGPKLSVSYLVFNTRRAPFHLKENRLGFVQAMNRGLFASFFQGTQIATSSWIPPGMVGYRQNIGVAAEGKPYLGMAGQQLRALYSGNDTWNLVFQSMARLGKENLGITLKPEQADWPEIRGLLAEGKKPVQPQLVQLGWVADYPDPHSFMNLFVSSNEGNLTGWKNQRYDELVEQAAATADERARADLYFEAQKILLDEEVVVMPLFFTSHQALVSSSLRGVNLNALDKWYFKNISREGSFWGFRSHVFRWRRKQAGIEEFKL